MSTALQKADWLKPTANMDTLRIMGKAIESQVTEALPGFLRAQAPAMLRALYTECQKNPGLLKCSPKSLFGAVIEAGQLGLMLGGAVGQAYLIPFKSAAQLVIGYKGLLSLANRSGQVGVVTAQTVYDRDTFSVEHGTSPKLVHVRGAYDSIESVRQRKSVAFYASCQTNFGAVFHAMSRAECEHHRDQFALSANGPWRNHFDAMSMKTCIRQLCKTLPMSTEFLAALNRVEALESGSAKPGELAGIWEEEEVDPAEELAGRLEEAEGE